MWTIKLTKSTNNFCTSDGAVRTVKVNMKERFIKKTMASCKYLCAE